MASNAKDADCTYQVYAIRYGASPDRVRGSNIIYDDRPAEPQPMDFFTWVIVGQNGSFVVDTGMHADMAARHGHKLFFPPTEVLPKLGVNPAEVDTVILTHLHYDHIGNLDDFPKARFFVQRREMEFVSGPYMEKHWFRRPYALDEVSLVLKYLYEGRVKVHGTDYQIAPGISVHWVGGHTAGQEIVRVRTARGWVVLASDSLHYYEEYERSVPFAVAYDLSQMLDAHERIRDLADSDAHIIPGHDPLVMERYAAPSAELEGVVVRVDA